MGDVKEFVQENGTKKFSSTRLIAIVTSLLVVGTWSYISIIKKEMQPIDKSVVALAMGTVGAKVWQRSQEEKTTTLPVPKV